MGSSASVTKKIQVLRDAIAKHAEVLQTLARQQDSGERKLQRLKDELASLEKIHPDSPLDVPYQGSLVPATAVEKVVLFRSLFRGRTDVYPKLWVNAKTGRTGYAPACGNEWVRGVCDKSSIRCGECPNQAFLEVTDRVILDHLQGRHVAGIYPLLSDETCWFLAADFDKRNWMTDIAAFCDVCRSVGMHVVIERSRSGNGAHARFFFDAPISAATARQVGCFLLTTAMSKHHNLDMSSYDRLFPNQDTMPRGGFGNLIALPLQRESRSRGNTVFVDDNFQPFPDQWAYLAGIQRISPPTVDRIAADALRHGQVLGVRASGTDEDVATTPWRLAPAHRVKPPLPSIEEPLPERVEATLAQRLFISKQGLPSSVINALKRLAAFQNPEFYKKQSMRLSTALTPRIISCAEDFPVHVTIPRGCVNDATHLFRSLGVSLSNFSLNPRLGL